MEWIRTHLYASTLAVAGLLIITGITIVQSHSPVDATASSMTWSGGVPAINMPTNQTAPSAIVAHIIQNQNPSALILPVLATSSPTSNQPSSGSFDYLGLLSHMSGGSGSAPPAAGSPSSASIIAQAYANVPQGFIATTATVSRPMTADQKVLYNYGNEIGSIIQAFETAHPNEAQVLKDQVADRTSTTKNAAVISLGKALVGIGAQMLGVSDVPASVASMHAALAHSYQDIGAKLQLVPGAQSDSEYVQAIKNYDATANIFVRNYATLASYLTASGVVFSAQDSGSVFSFGAVSGQ